MPLTLDDKDERNEALFLHEAARQIWLTFNRRAQHLGFTRAQWRVLSILRRNPGINQAAVAEQLDIEPITLVRQLDRLQRAGFIERRANPQDRRSNMLYLTDNIAPSMKQMRGIALSVRGDALQGFSEAEHETLLSYLKRIKTNLAKAAEHS